MAAAIEIDPVHCAVHEFNFPRTATIPHPIETLSGADILESAGIAGRRVDCVFGGAPCQGFSLIGHRALDDPRNGLVRDFVRIIAEIEPRTFVFENVKGLTIGRHREFLDELIEEFSRIGYVVREPWRVLNAGHFGTPQSRERLILLGAREGDALSDYPEPTTEIASPQQRIVGLPEGPTCSDALRDLPDVDGIEDLTRSDATDAAVYGEPSEYAAELRCLSEDAWHFGYVREWDPSVLTSSARTGHTEISRRRFRETAPGTVEPISRFFRLPEFGVSNTLRAGTDGARGAFTSPRPIHYLHDRCVTVREMARLHGFPGLVPIQCHQVARRTADRELGPATACEGDRQRGHPGARRDSGSTESRDLPRRSRASVVRPLECRQVLRSRTAPSRRDRKSGARKRKQIDIERERLGTQAARV